MQANLFSTARHLSRALLLSSPLIVTAAVAGPSVLPTRRPADFAGAWELSLDRTNAACRVILQGARSDKGDYFLGMPAACRHAMPAVASVGRWTMPDATSLELNDPAGTTVLALVADGDGFAAAGPTGRYTLTRVRLSASGNRFDGDDVFREPAAPTVQLVASKRSRAAAVEKPSDLAGRYAVMREKRDTGCMITLDDSARVAGGERAQLAPGCRDQGIVIFDPSAWQLVKGELVLTARAGHKARLEKQADGSWAKDPKEGKPLGLKKL